MNGKLALVAGIIAAADCIGWIIDPTSKSVLGFFAPAVIPWGIVAVFCFQHFYESNKPEVIGGNES